MIAKGQKRNARGQLLPMPLEDRFWPRVGRPNLWGCRPWLGRLNAKGYGLIALDGSPRLAHRVMWELVRGPIPAGLGVLHRCDNPRCVNIEHLWLGTQADNQADMAAKGRSCRGEARKNSKLTEEAVREIRGNFSDPSDVLAVRYGVSPRHIRKIRSGEKWAHV